MIRQGREKAEERWHKKSRLRFQSTGGFCLLDFRLQENVLADEQRSQDVHERRDLVAFSTEQVDDYVRYAADRDAFEHEEADHDEGQRRCQKDCVCVHTCVMQNVRVDGADL